MNSTKNVMHLWFQHLFEQRMSTDGFVKCFECDRPLHENPYKTMSICYSHLLGKKEYPNYAGLAENIVIVCSDCHNLYTMKPQQAKKQYNAYLTLKQKLIQ